MAPNPSFQRRPRAKKPSNARTTMMMTTQTMMLKTHPLLDDTCSFRPFDTVKPAALRLGPSRP
jgi:hypothetical protein